MWPRAPPRELIEDATNAGEESDSEESDSEESDSEESESTGTVVEFTK